MKSPLIEGPDNLEVDMGKQRRVRKKARARLEKELVGLIKNIKEKEETLIHLRGVALSVIAQSNICSKKKATITTAVLNQPEGS